MALKRADSAKPSIIEVARHAGVSHQTVSRVINHAPNVAHRTRAKVLEAIAELGYKPRNYARTLSSRQSRTIGLIAGSQRFHGAVTALTAIENTAREQGMFVSISMIESATCTQEEFDSLCAMLEQQGIDGFIVLAPTDAMFRAVCKAKITQPRVCVTSTHGTMSIAEGMRLLPVDQRHNISLVGVDQWGGMSDIMRLVTKYGHKQVLFFAGPMDWRDAATRLVAWNTLCAQHAMNSITVKCGSWQSGEAYRRMNHILDNIGSNGGRLPTCIVCSNDAMAMGVIRALLEHGVRVPQDVSVTGFDNMLGVDNLFPPLTTVEQDFEDLGVMTMKEMLYLLNKSSEPGYTISQHGVGLVPAHVVARQSLRPVSSR